MSQISIRASITNCMAFVRSLLLIRREQAGTEALRTSLAIRTIGALIGLTAVYVGHADELPARSSAVTFVFTSDVHFGIKRDAFRGASDVESRVVNTAMVRQINALPMVTVPADGGLKAGETIGPIDFVTITGDLANRQESAPLKIQSASASWAQLASVFIGGLSLNNASGRPTPLLLVPGNHDVSNAIGAPKEMSPEQDATSMVEIFNRMMQPVTLRTNETYKYETDKIYYAKDFGGVHCVFLTMWPDSVARAWIEADLKSIPATMPVFLFAHDPPEIDARHLTNPNGTHTINRQDKFENVVADVYADGIASDGETTIEQRALASFLKAHNNIVAYFHGHENWNESYIWKGPDRNLELNVFRADSPMKGKFSAHDESKLSFQVVVFDMASQKLTAREYLWNASGDESAASSWGSAKTVSIAPR